MDWFQKAVKRKLERRGHRVRESDNFAFNFISTNPKGEKVGTKCQPHGHLNTPQRRKLLSFGIPMYVASAKYVSDPRQHDVKIERIKLGNERNNKG